MGMGGEYDIEWAVIEGLLGSGVRETPYNMRLYSKARIGSPIGDRKLQTWEFQPPTLEEEMSQWVEMEFPELIERIRQLS